MRWRVAVLCLAFTLLGGCSRGCRVGEREKQPAPADTTAAPIGGEVYTL
jgi:hypothetical protein